MNKTARGVLSDREFGRVETESAAAGESLGSRNGDKPLPVATLQRSSGLRVMRVVPREWRSRPLGAGRFFIYKEE